MAIKMTEELRQELEEAYVEYLKQLECEHKELKRLLDAAEEVVNDFLPNLSNCVLQDYGRLNQFLIDIKQFRENSNG